MRRGNNAVIVVRAVYPRIDPGILCVLHAKSADS
jgi:hypothetical protein